MNPMDTMDTIDTTDRPEGSETRNAKPCLSVDQIDQMSISKERPLGRSIELGKGERQNE